MAAACIIILVINSTRNYLSFANLMSNSSFIFPSSHLPPDNQVMLNVNVNSLRCITVSTTMFVPISILHHLIQLIPQICNNNTQGKMSKLSFWRKDDILSHFIFDYMKIVRCYGAILYYELAENQIINRYITSRRHLVNLKVY